MKYMHEIHDALLKWYAENKRDLPWRKTKDPYKIWVSEVMLQQTQVETVKGYYERFLAAFPTVADLANAPEDQLMKLWEGLGYYSRARNLKRAAIMLIEQYDGLMPDDLNEISRLPGIGPYTAGAVLSIAYDKPVAAVDGNVIRVYSRLFSIEEPVDQKETKLKINEISDKLAHDTDPSSYNQSLMELGATICTPRNPKCEACPVFKYCMARQAGIAETLPKKMPKKAKKVIAFRALVVKNNEDFILIKRPPGGLLEGLWSLPSLEEAAGADLSEETVKQCVALLEDELGISADFDEHLGTAVHVFTHIRWEISVLAFDYKSGNLPDYPECIWVNEQTMKDYAIATAFQKALRAAGIK